MVYALIYHQRTRTQHLPKAQHLKRKTKSIRPNVFFGGVIYCIFKKFKDKKFAAKCDREVIRKGCEMLGMEVKDVAAICIEAMKAHAEELQISPKEA